MQFLDHQLQPIIILHPEIDLADTYMVERRELHRHKAPHDHVTIYCSFVQKSEMALIEEHECSLWGTGYLGPTYDSQYRCTRFFFRQSNLPILTPRLCDIGKYYLFDVLIIGHFVSIFTRKNNKLEAPESI
jgi:hypothetical protein